MTLPDPAPRWRIGQLSGRVGVSPELLRAWEQRYGLIRPARSSGGFRLYSAADEVRVRRVLALKETGLATAEAVDVALAEDIASPAAGIPERPVSPTPDAGDEMRRRLTSALESFDEAATQATVDRAFAAVGVDAAVQAVVLPALRDIGESWERGVWTPRELCNQRSAGPAHDSRAWRGEGRGVGRPGVRSGELHVMGLLAWASRSENVAAVRLSGSGRPIAAMSG